MPRPTPCPLLSPAALRPLGDEAEDLSCSLFACGFTTTSVQGRQDVGAELPASTSATRVPSALDAARSLPLKVRVAWRGLPVTGSKPEKARNCQRPGERSRMVPGRFVLLVLAMTPGLPAPGPY